MLIKGLLEEDFTNYKRASMFIIFPFCDFKCDRENGNQFCQNWSLSKQKAENVPVSTIIEHYINNPITHSIVCGGLEPLDSFEDLLELIKNLRDYCDDAVVIYTGYNKEEIVEKLNLLKQFKNIIVKFGRFRPNQTPHYDEVLGVNLASDNQYAEKIS